MLVVLIVELPYRGLNKNVPFTQRKQLVRHVNIFLPHFKVEEMNPSLKPKSLVRHVKLFQVLSCYKVEQSKSKDFELDDVYVSLVDDPISSSDESMMSFMRDHVAQ